MLRIEGHTLDETLLNQDSIIIDIGGNQGNFSRQMLALFNCQIECYEPDITAFFYISCSLLDEKFIAFQRAVAGQSGKRTFYCAEPFSGGNSILENHSEFQKQAEANKAKTYQVNAVSFASILKRYPRVDLVKLDCEGAELEIIHSTALEDLKKVQQFTIEFHDFCFQDISKEKNQSAIQRLVQAGFVETPVPEGTGYGDRHFFRPW